MPTLSGQARIAGVLGWPVAHSRSPRLHGYWLERYRIDGAYLPLPVRPEEFERAVRGMVAMHFAGANVTIPHKLAAFAISDELDDTARRAGAVNTLLFREGRIIGRNTDGYGFIANLRGQGVDPAAGPALLLGAGGSTRAIAAALQDAGAPVSVVNRTRANADELAADLPGLRVLDWQNRGRALAEYALIVNTTALGMSGDDRLPIDLERAAPGTTVADIVYVPLETPLLAAARARGLRPVDGLGMLLHQARPGFAEWFGVEPEVDEALRRFVAADLIGE